MLRNSNNQLRALIIEDDASIVELISIHLTDLGFAVDDSQSGRVGLNKALQNKPDLIVLDVMLPELDGMEICKQIRQQDIDTPIMMLTSRSEELDKVLGLELGADEYITKPFSVREFIARVKALFRRIDVEADKAKSKESLPVLRFNDLAIDQVKRRVTVDNKAIDLTAKEYDLLLLFAKNPGRTYSRQQLLNQVWGYQFLGYEHTVNSHINRLRTKIEKDPSHPIFIQTVWSVGYRFIDPEEL